MSNEKSITDNISTRLKSLRKDSSLTQAAFAEKLGIKQSTYNEIETGKREPSDPIIITTCYRFTINEEWLREGRGKMYRDVQTIQGEVKEQSLSWEPGGVAAISEWHSLPGILPAGYVTVPRYEIAASAGNGALVHSEQIVDHLAFKSEWLKVSLGLSPNKVAVISVIGDSMEPYLAEGDLIMVDLGVTSIENNAVYVLQFGDSLLVKRVQVKLDGEVIVKSDNPRYETESFRGESAERLRVVGRMVRRLVR
jgi:phage repressor protein C with HTH and peptisase S24 domain